MGRTFIIAVAVLAMESRGQEGGEAFEFERMWPALQQPWYFGSPDGLAVDSKSNVFVADERNHRILKFTPDGQVLIQWGTRGSDPGQFTFPYDVAVGPDDRIYVLDSLNYRIQVFTSNGEFVFMWGGVEGTGPGEFDFPRGIAIAENGDVFVVDSDNDRVQKFTSTGEFLSEWGSFGTGSDQFDSPEGAAIGPDGNVYIADFVNKVVKSYTPEGEFLNASFEPERGLPRDVTFDSDGILYVITTSGVVRFELTGTFVDTWGERGEGIVINGRNEVLVSDNGADRIQKFTREGRFISRWSASGSRPGEFVDPEAALVGPDGLVYVADTDNHRIQVFTSDADFVREFGEFGAAPGQLKYPQAIAFDANGNLVVAEAGNERLQVLTSEGEPIASWGLEPGRLGAFPTGIGVDSINDVYVVDSFKVTVEKFSIAGDFLLEWGSDGSGPGQFKLVRGIAIDSSDRVYVNDIGNDRVDVFDTTGGFLFSLREEDSGVRFGTTLSIDSDDNLYFSDNFDDVVRKFSNDGEFLGAFGGTGTRPGLLNEPNTVGIGLDGRVYVPDSINHRMTTFRPATVSPNNKAVLAVGTSTAGGSRAAFQMAGNLAYQALTLQGYSRDSILYFTENTEQDIDGNGQADDVDGAPSRSNLETGLVDWAADADNVVVYLVGAGDADGFSPNDTERLTASQLDGFLDALQAQMPGALAVVYDATSSGSFVPALAAEAGQLRATITSTAADEGAFFLSQGTLSFSNLFWINVFAGLNVRDAFEAARARLSVDVDYQTPQLDDDGTGVANEASDGVRAAAFDLFNQTRIADAGPILGNVSPPQVLTAGQIVAEFFADNVGDDSGVINRVWGVVTPPETKQNGDIVDLQEFELKDVGLGRYEGAFDGFVAPGIFTVDFFALDENLNVSHAARTNVEKVILPNSLVVQVVRAEDLTPVVGAQVRFSSDAIASQVTNEGGIAVVSPIQPGSYEVTVEASPYPSLTRIVEVTGAAVQTVTFEMGAGGPDPGPSCAAAGPRKSNVGADALAFFASCVVLAAFTRGSSASHRSH